MHPISEASRRSGVSIETIRYYERQSVVAQPARTEAGRRAYSEDDIIRLRFVKRCRDLGFPITDVRALLEMADPSDADCAHVRSVSERHLKKVRSKLKDLRQMERKLEALIEGCNDGSASCPAIEHLYRD